tara:strand:- start:941 stop:1381 length:441 start_codon:yes stop_codon:yes gene_type:complete
MKILFPLLFLVFASCHSQKKLVEKALEAKNPSFQKYLPGDGGGKGILFFVEFPHVSANIKISQFSVNDQILPFKLVGYKDGEKLEALCFYENPERNPDAKNSMEEFENAPLFRAQKYSAVIQFQIDGQSDTIQVNSFKELEIQMYP